MFISRTSPLEGNSLFIFSPDNKIRLAIRWIVSLKYFDNIVLSIILISSVLLILENPLSDPSSRLVTVLEIIDEIITAIFILEMVFKVVMNGFLFNGKSSYLRNGWNVLDFSIVFISVIFIIQLIYLVAILFLGWQEFKDS
jgi:hypothetical protein